LEFPHSVHRLIHLDLAPCLHEHQHLIQWPLVTGPVIATMWTWDCSAEPDRSSNRQPMYVCVCVCVCIYIYMCVCMYMQYIWGPNG
jgi:hypothetical protein